MDVIEEDEFQAVRRVLDEVISRKEAAHSKHYPNRQKTLLAVAILQGAGVQNTDLASPRGVYANILAELTIRPGLEGIEVQQNEFGGTVWPAWLKGVTGENLVTHSRKLGLHRSKPANTGVDFVGSPAFARLFQGKEGKRRASLCKIWYEEALQAVLEHNGNVCRGVKVVRNPIAELRENFQNFMDNAGKAVRHPRLATASDMRQFSEDLRKFVEENCPEA